MQKQANIYKYLWSQARNKWSHCGSASHVCVYIRLIHVNGIRHVNVNKILNILIFIESIRKCLQYVDHLSRGAGRGVGLGRWRGWGRGVKGGGGSLFYRHIGIHSMTPMTDVIATDKIVGQVQYEKLSYQHISYVHKHYIEPIARITETQQYSIETIPLVGWSFFKLNRISVMPVAYLRVWSIIWYFKCYFSWWNYNNVPIGNICCQWKYIFDGI